MSLTKRSAPSPSSPPETRSRSLRCGISTIVRAASVGTSSLLLLLLSVIVASGPPYHPYTAYAKASSLLTVDPGRLLSVLTRYGGVVLPRAVEHDLAVLNDVCHCEASSVDVVRRVMEIRNLTVSSTDQHKPALRVGRLLIKWDSYLQPCLEVELEDVDILVESTNLMLTRNNWNELADAGFPPTMYMSSEPTTDDKDSTSVLLRIGSVDLKGVVRLCVWSRPLNKSILLEDHDHFAFDLRSLEDLTERIKIRVSHSSVDRKGITTTELSSILSEYVNAKIQSLLRNSATELARSALLKGNKRGDTPTAGSIANNFFNRARDTVASYANDVTTQTVEDGLARMGVNSKESMELLKNAGKIASDAAAEGMKDGEWKKMLHRGIQTASKEALSHLLGDDDIDAATPLNKKGSTKESDGQENIIGKVIEEEIYPPW